MVDHTLIILREKKNAHVLTSNFVAVILHVLMSELMFVAISLYSEEDVEDIRGFPRENLIALCKYEPIKQWMRSCDHILYQALVEILIPDVLRPVPS